jgi:hypothetical protein
MAQQIRYRSISDLANYERGNRTGAPGIGYGFIVLNEKNFGNLFQNLILTMQQLPTARDLFSQGPTNGAPTFRDMAEYVQSKMRQPVQRYDIVQNEIASNGSETLLVINWVTKNQSGRISNTANLEQTVQNRVRRHIQGFWKAVKRSFGEQQLNQMAGGRSTFEHSKERHGTILDQNFRNTDLAKVDQRLTGTARQAKTLLELEKAIDDVLKANNSTLMDSVSNFFANIWKANMDFSDEVRQYRTVKEIADTYTLYANFTWDDGRTRPWMTAQNSGVLDTALAKQYAEYLASNQFIKDVLNYIKQNSVTDAAGFFAASPKLEDAYLGLAADQIIKELKGKKYFNTKIKKSSQSKKNSKGKSKVRGKNPATNERKATGLKNRRINKGTKQSTRNSPIALKNIINKFLPQTLKSMMVSPRLVYRTGRFANSARVENIYQGSRGGYSADYTYMKNPYQTFEPGFNMGSTFRDPRSIISTAIRNIALEQMGIKFGQVRRT